MNESYETNNSFKISFLFDNENFEFNISSKYLNSINYLNQVSINDKECVNNYNGLSAQL